MSTSTEKDILIVEPFNGGSHGQLISLIQSDSEIGPKCTVVSLPAKKWHWRARTSALYLSQKIPFFCYRAIFTSSVLNLAELIALRPDLAQLKKIVYFHENQLVYPVRKAKDRDFQYGYNQILTSLVADIVVFNSAFNMESFLTSISSHLKLIPDHRPKNLEAIIRPKCRVLNFPVNSLQVSCEYGFLSCFATTSNIQDIQENNDLMLEDSTASDVKYNHENSDRIVVHDFFTSLENGHEIDTNNSGFPCKSTGHEELQTDRTRQNCCSKSSFTVVQSTCDLHSVSNNVDLQQFKKNKICLHIVWPHRWEHDKDPDSFFKAILQLQSEGLDFRVSVVGETFTDVPDIFHEVKPQLAGKIVAWGYQTQQDYFRILDSAHVAVSTALHEFFGVSMLEATDHGCFPLCPKRLVYPEIYPEDCLYSTQTQLIKKLRRFCQRPDLVKTEKFKVLVGKYSWHNLQKEYRKLLLE